MELDSSKKQQDRTMSFSRANDDAVDDGKANTDCNHYGSNLCLEIERDALANNSSSTMETIRPFGGATNQCYSDSHDDDDEEADSEHDSGSHGNGSSNSNNQNNNNNNNNNNGIGNRTTDAQTMMHILKANIGTGVLAMPSAFRNVGLWPGFVLVPLIGAICIHCMNILIASHNRLCDRFNYESLDYDQVAALGLACGPRLARRLAKYAHIVVTSFLMLTQLGFCCVYILFVVDNLQLAVLNLFGINYSTITYMLLVFPLIGLTSCTSNLKHLARISTLANVLQLTGLSLIFFDLLQFHTYSNNRLFGISNTNESTTTLTSLNDVSNATQPVDSKQLNEMTPDMEPQIRLSTGFSDNVFSGAPLFFATAVYAFEGIGVVLPLVKEMQSPERISGLSGVLNTSMSMVTLLYMGVGFFGYSKYGQFVEGSITLNLPETMLNELVRLIFALAIGLSYSLQFYVPWTTIWPLIDEALFYSYRPRVARDKLQILSKLSKENQWAIEQILAQSGSECDELREDKALVCGQSQSEQQLCLFQDDCCSNASTFATSYCVSNYGAQQMTSLKMRTSSSNTMLKMSQSSCSQAATQCQYGAIQQQQKNQLSQKNHQQYYRNRLEDVMEQSGEELPQVQWRPPPRSMRGKRKLVRYTVILVTVSFTFVAAALIPSLDLFISLIGSLASSCLAIIFPAIIQLCTFWNPDYNETDDDQDDQQQQSEDSDCNMVGASKAGAWPPASSQHQNQNQQQQQQPTRQQMEQRTRKRATRRSFLWCLFVLKNCFLVLFGILGLVTGGFVSITQLSAVYLGLEVR